MLRRMDHFRLRKYRGPEVWARVRQAYEAGESGPSVAQRFDIDLANLRKKCRLEGWSRRHQAERSDRDLPGGRIAVVRDLAEQGPVDRQAALAACLDHAAAAMARGEGPAALAALKAARAYTELTGQLHDPAAEAERTATRWRAIEALCRSDAVRTEARKLAEGMLAGTPQQTQSQTAMMYHWRAEHLGPEAAAGDYARALADGSAGYYWDDDGVLKPLRPSVMHRLGRPAAEEGEYRANSVLG
ncbi:MAG: hypothetical protein PSV23_03100 [Brevundimonas sp.]|uniref:hypothetical protein n=1 Tax=Brevundimonas sp. TaxID=1871086 RepID=UPI0024882079|nr:hypothetical protein [Brevundimonas sp.]MDI1325767.1 hypothetical protein [Brevundimonas sp.]